MAVAEKLFPSRELKIPLKGKIFPFKGKNIPFGKNKN